MAKQQRRKLLVRENGLSSAFQDIDIGSKNIFIQSANPSHHLLRMELTVMLDKLMRHKKDMAIETILPRVRWRNAKANNGASCHPEPQDQPLCSNY